MKCPRCATTLTAKPDPSGILTCQACGAKLRTRPPSAPPGPAAPAAVAAPASPAPAAARPEAAARPPLPADATVPAGPPPVPRPAPAPPAAPPAAPEPPAPQEATLEAVLAQLQALRAGQDEILTLLRGRPTRAAAPAPAGPEAEGTLADLDGDLSTASPSVRSRRRKTVLLFDDDSATCMAAVSAFRKADIPVRAVGEGNAGLAAIADEKPDVIVLELDLAGSMSGKDVVNLIKATMEWVDIPIILYTRLAVESQKEARTVHGADDFVLKSAGADPLVAKVISFFRKA